MKRKSILTVFFGFALAASAAHGQKIPAMEYLLTPVPMADRTELQISLRFKTTQAAPLTVRLPVDCFGTPNLERGVKDFRGTNGTVVRPGAGDAEKIVEPVATGEVDLSYTLSYDPVEMRSRPYAPGTGPGYLHLAGCQWLLPVGDDKEERELRVKIGKVPAGWKMYSSSSPDPMNFSVRASYDALSSAAIGGGTASHVFHTGKNRVTVFAHGSLQIPQQDLFRSIERLVRLQRKWFSDDGQPDYTIVVAPRPGFRAGFAPDNMFVCFVDPATRATDLNLLVAHEFFHNWLPNKIEIVHAKEYSSLRYEWFNEGFPEYFAHKILRDAELLTETEFSDAVNANIMNIVDNPNRSKSYDDLVQMAKAGKFDGDAKKLAYFRGFLMALNWDTRMKRKDPRHDLSSFMRELYGLARSTDGKISEGAFFKLADEYGIDAPSDLARYIILGEPIEPDPNSLGPFLRLESTTRDRFAAGFDVAVTFRSKILNGVDVSGPAYKAGLRNGMAFVNAENLFRFSNWWRRDRPVTVTIKTDGVPRTVEYWPRGEEVSVKLFVPSK